MITSSGRNDQSVLIRVSVCLVLLLWIAAEVSNFHPVLGASLGFYENDPDGDPIGSPPVFVSVLISSPILENNTASLSGEFSDPNPDDSFTLIVGWGDGDSDLYNYPIGTTTFNETHQYLDDDPTGTSSDQYTVDLQIIDNTGLSDTETTSVIVNNIAPALDNISVTSAVNENETATLEGDITDAGSLDTFTLDVNWGDGTTDTYHYSAGTTSFSETHQYLDDDPTGTSSDDFTISLTLTDDDTGTDSTSTSITVNNVPPVVSAGPDQQAYPNQMVSFSGDFSDPGSLDTHTIEWDFGDSTPGASGSLTPTHVYTSPGVYTVTLTVSDDDTGSGFDTLEVTINGYILHLPLSYR